MLTIFRHLMKNEHGATAIEYTLIASLVPLRRLSRSAPSAPKSAT
jgi:hypothetical protein